MTYNDFVNDITEMIIEVSGEEKATIYNSLDELGMDSINCVEFVMNIEKKFDIGIPDESVDKIKGDYTFYRIMQLLSKNYPQLPSLRKERQDKINKINKNK